MKKTFIAGLILAATVSGTTTIALADGSSPQTQAIAQIQPVLASFAGQLVSVQAQGQADAAWMNRTNLQLGAIASSLVALNQAPMVTQEQRAALASVIQNTSLQVSTTQKQLADIEARQTAEVQILSEITTSLRSLVSLVLMLPA